MQKFLKRMFQLIAGIAAIICSVLMTIVIFYYNIMPNSFHVIEGENFEIKNITTVTGTTALNYNKISTANMPKGSSETINLRLFGFIPIKAAHVNVIENPTITPGGTPFGIKLFTKGVIVIDINNVQTNGGVVSPARLAGITKGDVILSVNSVEVYSNEQVAGIIENSNGEALSVTLKRDNNTIKTILKPACSSIDGKYKSGLWVRDSSAGIGTITYYLDDGIHSFGGLGHGICDIDTGKIMPLNSGEVCPVTINSIAKGKSGTPGELRGSFSSAQASGKLLLNSEAGIFGTLEQAPNSLSPVEIKLKQEVQVGDAQIICTLDNNGPKAYDIKIEKVSLNPKALTKNMVICVTDPSLLSKTGGIVQGMSGSPILQDGQLVGAVTHVFVNNPQKGYGIFAENMLNFTQQLANVS